MCYCLVHLKAFCCCCFNWIHSSPNTVQSSRQLWFCKLGSMRAIWIAISLCLAVVDAQEPITFAACTENDTVIRQARIAAIRDEIMAKLHLTEPPPNPRKLTAINKSTLSAYRAAVQTANRQSLGRSRECRRDTFFAKLLSVYFPTSYRAVIPPADMFEWGKGEVLRCIIFHKRPEER